MPQQLSVNTFSVAKIIVSPLASNGTHTSITSALASASSGDTIWVRDGTYTENFTLPAGVILTAAVGSGDEPNVTIIGKVTMTAAGTSTISNIRLQTNSDFAVAVTGSAASILNIENCYINCSNNTGISFTTTNASAVLFIRKSRMDVTTTGISYYAFSSTGNMFIYYSVCDNSGGSSTASINSSASGNIFFRYSQVRVPIQASSTGNVNGEYSIFQTSGTNSTCINISGTAGSNLFYYCEFASGSASAITSAGGVQLYYCNISSSNTNALTGAGTISSVGLTFPTSLGFNTTTQTIYTFGPFAVRTVSPAGDYTVLPSDGTIFADTTGARAITLPTAPLAGQTHTVKDRTGTANANNITISGNGSNINGAATNVINTSYGFRKLTYSGTIWAIVATG